MSSTVEHNSLWKVDFSNKAEKQQKKLPPIIREILYVLKGELEQEGPEQSEWRNYSQIVGATGVHHCHLNNNHPRYVVIWKATDIEKQEIEIRFVGPHGSVNYSRFT